MTTPPPATSSASHLGACGARIAADAGAVLVGWLGLLALEQAVVAFLHDALFAGSWELRSVRTQVTPIALGALLPLAFVAVGLGSIASKARSHAGARAGVTLSMGAAAALVAYGVSFGRHMASWSLRGSFIAGIAAVAAAAGYWVVPRLAMICERRWPAIGVGIAGTVAFWCADAFILPRLYPAFHAALLLLTLASAALIAPDTRTRGGRAVAVAALALAVASLAWTKTAARRLASADNLRLILTEYAPVLGQAVRLAAFLAPPPPLEPTPDDVATSLVGEIPRALDWSGKDLLLISVDALRADHVSAYGYARPTTPNLDALAGHGALFLAAYCPTPHTSYSVTSMMTGKAMRPLLSLGLGKGSETWAAAVQRYGYRTAGFYPPAVFFIDEERFTEFETSGLGFEYRKVEFASASQRVDEVAEYLGQASNLPLFLWVHLFEPHEPYVMHPGHGFGEADPLPIDAYDSEIAYADENIGRLVALVSEKRPGLAIMVTADHGEEFGEHGGRYHGTSCYEEQVHVPLIITGPGVAARRIPTVVQTIDLLPTALSALGIPRPARLQGRDLGPMLGAKAGAREMPDVGRAYAETDEYTLLARGNDRLVCARKLGACALFDAVADPSERRDLVNAAPGVARELRAALAAVERDQGRFEDGLPPWPEALRRGLQGDAEAAEDVGALLDDANVAVRRKAAEVTFALHQANVAAQARQAARRDEDDEVRRWCALALVRMGKGEGAGLDRAASLLLDQDPAWRRRAALALAEQGDARGAGELAAWWKDEAPPRSGLDVQQGKELLNAMARIRDLAAVPALLASLDFVPLRPWLANALGTIGDVRARGPLLHALIDERYVSARVPEARALLALGARGELVAPLARFAGIADPMIEAIAIARDARILAPSLGGVAVEAPTTDLRTRLTVPVEVPLRLLVLAAEGGAEVTATLAGQPTARMLAMGAAYVKEYGPERASSAELLVHAEKGVLAAWVVPRATDVGSAPAAQDGGALPPSAP